jgi:hypothetical protein
MLHFVDDKNVALAKSDILVAHMKLALALDGDEDLQSLMPVEPRLYWITFERNWPHRKWKRRVQF